MDDPDLTVGIGSDIDLPPRSSPPVRQPVDEKLQRLLDKALYGGGHQSAQRIRNFLNGTWLGEPLHVVLTDVPVGAWTAEHYERGLLSRASLWLDEDAPDSGQSPPECET